ncbi:MAG: HlyD family type I secretion periplasmic adaptor subunit [Betaproteobacteria bacterium]|nr:HlyD family type I secretion periplasmic adaptor subunit [Betaproteobacteria bacterium]NDE53263.1 HlyD family type I secretion periplasmic adaptor subunit [Actinomycetota bacterium]NBP36042.1 HlyD family type I secretion periplasmic adaptor subunit [Betaproteobacteria bacterium]NBP38589.1 HlyD family type I secretion periplasmic adaptor subunit [Betaproteobacteria bacterium]NBT05521.1 HlyD family type I secretion periplasmic adaptor subunit [Betaproteobacteria bacterium]
MTKAGVQQDLVNQKGKGDQTREATTSLRDLEFLPDPDAIEQRPLGGVTRGVLLLLSAMLVTAMLWSWLSTIDEIVTASGRLISSVPNILVQPLETSIVQSIDVKAGQIVRKDQQLASLDPTFTGADRAMLKGSLDKLDARIRRLDREIASGVTTGPEGQTATLNQTAPAPVANTGSIAQVGVGSDDQLQAQLREARESNFKARMRSLEESTAKLEASQRTNLNDQKMLAERLKSLQEVEQMQERLISQNFGARRQLLEARERRQEVERELQLVNNREFEIRKEISVAKAERAAFQNEWRQRVFEELSQLRREREGLAEQLAKADKRGSLVVLRSPSDAVVLEIPKRSVGSIVRDAEPMFTLVPVNTPLEAELQIASPDVGFIKTGDAVRIKLDAFPFQKYGTLRGTIAHVSEDAFVRDPPAGSSARQASSNYYIARVLLDSTKLERHADEVILRPGSTLQGEVRIGERSVLSYFVYPLIGTLDRSLRERR